MESTEDEGKADIWRVDGSEDGLDWIPMHHLMHDSTGTVLEWDMFRPIKFYRAVVMENQTKDVKYAAIKWYRKKD